jgi:hypothetical protein
MVEVSFRLSQSPAPLFHAGHDVITKIRLLDER